MNDLFSPLSVHSGVPMYRQIRDQLIQLIHGGRLAEGSILPSIRELAATMSVSVITVKGAYEELEHLGVIVARQGHGTTVAPAALRTARKFLQANVAQELQALAEKAERLGMSHDEFLHAVGETKNVWPLRDDEQSKTTKRSMHGKK